MQVVDDLVDPHLAKASREFIAATPSLYGWKAHSSASGSFWHQNHVLPGIYEHHYDDGTWNPELSYDAFVKSGSPLSVVAEKIRHDLFCGVKMTRVWVNIQTFGDESAFHRDFPDKFIGSARTAVWYPVESWERDWGGDFVTLDKNGEIDDCIMVKPNRLVVFDGTTPHAARPISRYCNATRIAVSFACEVVK
jgi:Rps23 Pro-64 3,4-dihydroxylase Tpa1-like proline 4-hydroxylase